MRGDKKIRMLFVGDLRPGTRSLLRYRAFCELGYELDALSFFPDGYLKASLRERFMGKLSLPVDIASVNKAIRERFKSEEYDVLWVEKGNAVRPSTVKFIRKNFPLVALVSISEDNMYLRHNHSVYYRRGLRYYDIVFTKKARNLEELKEFGARNIKLFLDSYDETLFRPLTLTGKEFDEYGADVGFVGTYERERADYMLFLAESGIRVRVFGGIWQDMRRRHENLNIEGRTLLGEEYAKAINAAKISLCFLRKLNFDEVTGRTMEIPACGGFMLAERTQRHLELFKEDEEAVFFSSREEMLEKAVKYLKDEASRNKIAAAGRKRCERSGYGMRIRLQELMDEVLRCRPGQGDVDS